LRSLGFRLALDRAIAAQLALEAAAVALGGAPAAGLAPDWRAAPQAVDRIGERAS
jgi:hypothetical protein